MAERTASPVRTLTAGAAALVILLALLTIGTGLGPTGWLAGIAFGVVGWVALTAALRHYDTRSFGPADRITLGRAVLVGGVTALVADTENVHVIPLVLVASVALFLDAVDGLIARRTGTVSPFGARFDMEVDAFLILVLSAFVATELGPWVVAIGILRYAFVAAGRVLPWLRASLPHSIVRKTVAATQGVVLTVAASGLLGQLGSIAVTGLALAVLTWSFANDVWWLHRHRVAEARPEPRLDDLVTAPARPRWRRAVTWATTGLAGALVLFAMVAPNELGRLTPAAFARIPVEGVIAVGLLLVLPTRSRKVMAALVGAGLGLLTIVKILDMGFYEALARPFDPVFDWSFFGPAVDFVGDAVGPVGQVAAVVGAIALAAALVVLLTLATLRLTRIAVGHRSATTRTVTVLGVVWVVSAVFGVQLAPGEPVAARTAAGHVYDGVRQVRAGLLDPAKFASEAAVDDFRLTPGEELLTGLRGKDVVVTFIESYGRVAIEHPEVAPEINALLDAGNDRLRAAGFASQSAYLTSSTSGGGSWFAHASLQSGLWIDNQQRYDALVAGDRLTLSGAFKRAGWRTVGIAPAINQDWPEGEYFGYEHIYGANNVGYRGPTFAYSKMPDQFTLSAFERTERAPRDRAPVMAEIDLTSSHSPWAPLPTPVDWADVGDGAIFDPQPDAGQRGEDIWPDPTRVRTAFGDAIEYSLETLFSYVETYGDDNLVLVFLGDHQPAPIVTGRDASSDVPITIVARDQAVLDRVADWKWHDGLNPGPNAPVWRMDDFRDRFLTAFGPRAPHTQVAAPR